MGAPKTSIAGCSLIFTLLLGCDSPPPARSAADVLADYRARMDRVKAEFDADIIRPVCDDPPKPGRKCGLLTDRKPTDDETRSFIQQRCGGRSDDACVERYRASIIESFRQRYSLADDAAIQKLCVESPAKCHFLSSLEILYATSHNDTVERRFEIKLDQLVREHAQEQDALAARAREDAAARARARAVMDGIAGGLAGAGAGLGNGTTSGPNRVGSTPLVQPSAGLAECTSDYSCGYGKHCVKEQFKATGICAGAVDPYGTPTYAPPRPSSIELGNPHQCQFDTDCPMGFSCQKGGGLYGTCMK